MFKLALRNVFRQKVRTGMTLAAIVFGVIGLILSGGFVHDVFIQLGEAVIHSQSGHLQVTRAGFYRQGSRAPNEYMISDAAALKGRIAALPQVSDVMGRIYFSGLLNNGKTDVSIIGEGIEPDSEAKLGTHIVVTAGRQLRSSDGQGLMLGEGIARAAGLKPGDQVTLLLNTSAGALNTADFVIIGVFQTYSKEFDARAVRIPLAAAQSLLNTEGVNAVVVSLKNTPDTAVVRARLVQRLDPQEFEVITWQQLNDFYEKTVDLYRRQFGILQVIVLFMVLLSVANSVNMSTFERVGEFGTMMALGNSRGHVFRLILVENAIVGLLGGLLGVTFGIVLAFAISAIGIPMPPPPNANLGYTALIRIVPEEIATAFAVGFLATLGASLLPAKKVGEIPVVDALRQSI
ncbi:MAG: ABC transporter permease [Candidatus Accumulibacter phosphatis]|uniref:ABC transporter permease n=1 Tax=Candidatus Thiothrix phosphatis TaxID=3112415 RepID=A0ABU6CV83_9GAMM|nr:ABC transporter permease [Candidatus Thiothrix sp. Deng01]MCQ1549067.1 ABC transporter permease [Candidatus Accumulibacter phosphatis]MEB4590739.1 ABC transporter permease [Candidatus Thiothrix sp. Deng01]